MAKFSRTSTAYKQDSSIVAAGVPRFERIGKNLLNLSTRSGLFMSLGTSGYLDSNNSLMAASFYVDVSAFAGQTLVISGNGNRRQFGFLNVIPTANSQIFNFTNLESNPSGQRLVTIPFGYKYMWIYVNYGVGFVPLNLQLELGTTATAYEPYQQGVMIEEGTPNLLTANQSSVETNTTGFSINNTGTTLTQDVTVAYSGNASLKVVTDGTKNFQGVTLSATVTSGLSYTFSIYLKGSGTVKITLSGALSAGKDVVLSNDWVRYTITATASASGSASMVVHTNAQLLATTFYADCLQLEQKAYATNWQIGGTARVAESLTVPASAIPVSEGTIQVDVMFLLASYVGIGYRYICDFGETANNRILAYTDTTTGKIVLQNRYGSTAEVINTNVTPIQNQKYRFAIKYKDKVEIWINGVKKGTSVNNHTLNPTTNGRIGFYLDGSAQANALFSNLRISSIARSDTELANVGALEVDEYTTYFLPLNGNLSATCRPVMLVQGQGQVLLSRVGRGTRAIKVQGSGQVKLKRSACYYPTIAVGTKGEVKLSRQGIGYRNMKVEGQGSFKIQEPNIEIYPEIREREATTNIIERESITEVIGVPYAGDTIKIKGTFKSFEGVAADPTSITLKIYDTINNLLTTINVTATNKISAGVYEVNYTVPEGYQALYYEWHCVQGDSPQVTMGKITVLKRGQA